MTETYPNYTKVLTTDKECTDDVIGAVIEYGYWDVPL